MRTYDAFELFYGWGMKPSKAAVAKLRQDECRHLTAMRERREIALADVCESLFAEVAV